MLQGALLGLGCGVVVCLLIFVLRPYVSKVKVELRRVAELLSQLPHEASGWRRRWHALSRLAACPAARWDRSCA